MLHHMLELLGYEGKKKTFLYFALILVCPATLQSCLRAVSYFFSISTIQFSYVVTFLKYVDNIIYVRLLWSMFKY